MVWSKQTWFSAPDLKMTGHLVYPRFWFSPIKQDPESLQTKREAGEFKAMCSGKSPYFWIQLKPHGLVLWKNHINHLLPCVHLQLFPQLTRRFPRFDMMRSSNRLLVSLGLQGWLLQGEESPLFFLHCTSVSFFQMYHMTWGFPKMGESPSRHRFQFKSHGHPWRLDDLGALDGKITSLAFQHRKHNDQLSIIINLLYIEPVSDNIKTFWVWAIVINDSHCNYSYVWCNETLFKPYWYEMVWVWKTSRCNTSSFEKTSTGQNPGTLVFPSKWLVAVDVSSHILSF